MENIEGSAKRYADRRWGFDNGSQTFWENSVFDFIEGAKFLKENTSNSVILYSEEEVLDMLHDIMNLGMSIRQDQLSGYCDKSGNEVLREWFKQNKKK